MGSTYVPLFPYHEHNSKKAFGIGRKFISHLPVTLKLVSWILRTDSISGFFFLEVNKYLLDKGKERKKKMCRFPLTSL